MESCAWGRENALPEKRTFAICLSFRTEIDLSKELRFNPKGDSLATLNMKVEEYETNNSNYVSYDVPWNFRLRYNLTYSNSANTERDYFMNAQVSGDFKLTPKWRIGYTVSYDIINNEFAAPKLNIYRDLNCWEMRIDWIPFGNYRSYGVYINIKANALKELKVKKTDLFYDI